MDDKNWKSIKARQKSTWEAGDFGQIFNIYLIG